jgi:hypothetical protein
MLAFNSREPSAQAVPRAPDDPQDEMTGRAIKVLAKQALPRHPGSRPVIDNDGQCSGT